VPLCLVILLQQSLRNGFDLGAFGGFHGKVFLRVDFLFLLIEWVSATEILAKGSPRGTPAISKVSLWSVERIRRSIAWSVEFFPRAVFFPTVQAKPVWPVSQAGLISFSPVGYHEGFLSEKASVVLWLFLFKGGDVLEAICILEGFSGSFRQNRPDWFAKLVWPVSPTCWEAKSHRSGLTGFRNWPDRF
jgi:hypothetical protein